MGNYLVYNLSNFNSVVSVKILSLYLDTDRWKGGLEVGWKGECLHKSTVGKFWSLNVVKADLKLFRKKPWGVLNKEKVMYIYILTEKGFTREYKRNKS